MLHAVDIAHRIASRRVASHRIASRCAASLARIMRHRALRVPVQAGRHCHQVVTLVAARRAATSRC
eukprot:scaffold63959_cov27-Tisochrysis_lutea.AAC.2